MYLKFLQGDPFILGTTVMFWFFWSNYC